MSADWHTPERLAFIKKHFEERKPDSWIADQLGISKGSIISWRRKNVGLRVDNKHPGGHPSLMESIATAPAPAWRSPEADRIFREAWIAGVITRDIMDFFSINTDQSDDRRVRLGLKPRYVRAPFAARNGWETPEGDAEIARRWALNEHSDVIMTHFGVSASAFKRRRTLLGLPLRTGNEVPRRPTQKTPEIPPPPPKQNHTTRGTRDVSGRGGSVFNFRTFTRAASGTVSHEAGRCRWPLTCGEPTAGTFCAEHAGLLRARQAA